VENWVDAEAAANEIKAGIKRYEDGK